MDEIFWSNVVKRWSEASENVIKLKNELAKVREERSYRNGALQEDGTAAGPHQTPDKTASGSGGGSGSRLSAAGGGGRVSGNIRAAQSLANLSASLRDDDVSRQQEGLKGFEIGFGRAKQEYRKLQHDLAESTETIKALRRENEKLKGLQEQVAQLRKENDEIQRLHKELKTLQSNNESLSKKMRALEQQHAARTVRKLQEALEDREAENDELLEELRFMKEKLRKAEEDKKILIASIAKLQVITRQPSALNPLSNSSFLQVRSGRSSGPGSVASSARSFRSENAQLLKPLDSTLHSKGSHSRLTEDVTVVVHDEPSTTVPASFAGMLEVRWSLLTGFSSVTPPAQYDATNNHFSREFLKGVLSGDNKGFLERFASQSKTPQKKATVPSYLCPTLNHHPWCPSIPGQHGFIFVGLGKEKDSYKTPVVRNLFVGLPRPSKGNRQFRYLGSYRVVRVSALDLEEWRSLPMETKTMLAKHSKEKTKDSRPYEEVFLAYDRGDARVPCVQLQCLDFDYDFYAALVAHRDARGNEIAL